MSNFDEQAVVVGKKVWDWGHTHTFIAGVVIGVVGTVTVQFWLNVVAWFAARTAG